MSKEIEHYETKVVYGYFYQTDSIDIHIEVYFDVDEIVLKNVSLYDTSMGTNIESAEVMGVTVFRSNLFDDKPFYTASQQPVAINSLPWVIGEVIGYKSPDIEQRYKLTNRRQIRGNYRFYINVIDADGQLTTMNTPANLLLAMAMTFEFRKYK